MYSKKKEKITYRVRSSTDCVQHNKESGRVAGNSVSVTIDYMTHRDEAISIHVKSENDLISLVLGACV